MCILTHCSNHLFRFLPAMRRMGLDIYMIEMYYTLNMINYIYIYSKRDRERRIYIISNQI